MPTLNVNVPVKLDTLNALLAFLQEMGSDRDPIDVIDKAIWYWMENAEWKREDLMPEIFKKTHRGYRWKSVLLPPGTKIRMTYRSQVHHAEIVGDHFTYEGRSVSPSEFANSVAGGTARNAWRDLWVKRPFDQHFVLADDLRRTHSDDLPRVLAEYE